MAYNLGLNGLFTFNRDGFSPHIALGGGVVYNDTRFDDGTSGYVEGGIGFRVPLVRDAVKLRFDVSYFLDFTDNVFPNEDTFGDVRISLGLEFPLGGSGPAPSKDSDGDGVPNELDRCPNTVSGAPVDANGCPLDADGDGVPDYLDQCPGTPPGVAIDARGCPLDSDGDGVPDNLDECPNTPASVAVNAQGCPQLVDADGDGVPDDRDRCPDTPAGVPVLTNGCAPGQSAVLQGVNFEFNSAELTASARRIMEELVGTLNDSPGFDVELAGHTDSVGSDSYNLDLSQRRTDSVRDYLVERGVASNRLRSRGYGESRPIASNDTETGRATNRRVELNVLKQTR